ncbi:uncharacterized protein LOC135476325 [Liolophura sinensis]|uniref:uncharacterized protein LOC135476325 n=1 Tax=Liolophura sinensis TaxID=3198878 RepID=UPI00315904D4
MEDLILENCRHRAIAGDHLDNVNLQRLEIKNTGSYGIFVKSSKHVTIRQCEIHDTDGGIHIDGGERKTLTSSGNLVENNHIWSFSRAGAVGQHGISVNGVGAVLQFNHIHDGRYTGIWWLGNDHMIRKNHVHHLCTGASDCGGIHTGRDWTCRGNVIKENHIHHVLRYMPGAQVRGIMLDDQYSSVTIENNVFHDNELHMNIGGGRDNIVRHNVFYNATHAAVGVDARGISGKFSQILFQRLKAIPYTNGLWTSRYPKLARIDSEEPNLPKGNEIYQNVFYGGSSSRFVPLGGYDPADWFNVHDNYLFAKPTDFNQRRSGDYRVICQVAQWVTRKGFSQPPTLNEIGPHLSVGPAFKHSALSTKTNMPLRTNCVTTTEAPSTKILQPQVVNDGSQPNTLTDKTGCWLIIDGCPQEPELAGKRRDTEGEQHHGALTDEDACLARAAVQWRACGQSYSHTVKAVFGPTGAWTVAGQGCFMGSYGCPSHGQTNEGSLVRDGYAEAHGGLTSEAACLGRAAGQWVYCGSSLDNPIVSIFRPTGWYWTASLVLETAEDGRKIC